MSDRSRLGRRRLPTFLLMDVSAATAGALSVVLQEGMSILRREVSENSLAARGVYLSAISCSPAPQIAPLARAVNFDMTFVHGEGQCMLGPALGALDESLSLDVLPPRDDFPGDFTPLIFLLLFSQPHDAWAKTYPTVPSVPDTGQSSPLVISLATPQVAPTLRPISNQVLTITRPDAGLVTAYFTWIAQTVTGACEAAVLGDRAFAFPALPTDITILP